MQTVDHQFCIKTDILSILQKTFSNSVSQKLNSILSREHEFLMSRYESSWKSTVNNITFPCLQETNYIYGIQESLTAKNETKILHNSFYNHARLVSIEWLKLLGFIVHM